MNNNNNNNNIQTSEQLSFWQLIQKNKIEIPIIQRDYAQGRAEKIKIRKTFLSALSAALEKTDIELDFVYGSNKDNSLQPLDGQQRLTTLFLLHWYVATKEDFLDNTVKNHLRNFTYKTRTSSRDFCTNLIEKGISFKNTDDEISTAIKDASWFFLSWEKDPTIKAMLIMLDAIHLEFKENHNLWEKLTNETNRPITFHYIELENFGLSDDLYIKMNARGKQLSPFENFKADFTKYINTKKWDDDKLITETFSHKIDTLWTDLFWKHRGFDNLIDNELIKFMAGVAINSYAQNQEIYKNLEDENNTKKILAEKSKGKVPTDEAVKRERIERRITTLFNNPTDVSPEDFPSKSAFDILKNYFDVYSRNKNDELLPINLLLWDFCAKTKIKINEAIEAENNLFIEFVKDAKTEYKQRVLFYAQTQFLSAGSEEFNNESFSEWMRVIRNIVQNATIDSADTLIGAISLVNELSIGCKHIYEFLSETTIKSGFAKSETIEEVLKSRIILSSSENKHAIFKTEDTEFLKGKIKFALHCIDYKSEGDNFNLLKLLNIQNVINEYLSGQNISNEFRSALLTVRNNDFYNYWLSWSYGTDSHKRCLIENIQDLKNNFTNRENFKDYLKDLLILLITENLNDIIQDYPCPDDMPNWKKRLIKEPQLLDKYGQSHFIGILDNNNSCFLFKNKKRPSDRKECKKID